MRSTVSETVEANESAYHHRNWTSRRRLPNRPRALVQRPCSHRNWTKKSGPVNGYDNSGNRTSAGNTTYNFDERNRLTGDSAGNNYSYDPRGDLTLNSPSTGPSTSYAFDAFDQLATNGSTSYAYDALGRVATRNGTQFSYSDTTNSLVSDGISTFTHDPTGQLVGLSQTGSNLLAYNDQHGDLVGTFTNTAISLTDSRAYDPWGNLLSTSGIGRAVGYQGQYTDPTTSQVNMAARWYDPTRGGFISRDSVIDPTVNSNASNYGADNPLTQVDPTGHEPIDNTNGVTLEAAEAGAIVDSARANEGRPGSGGNILGSIAAGVTGAVYGVKHFLFGGGGGHSDPNMQVSRILANEQYIEESYLLSFGGPDLSQDWRTYRSYQTYDGFGDPARHGGTGATPVPTNSGAAGTSGGYSPAPNPWWSSQTPAPKPPPVFINHVPTHILAPPSLGIHERVPEELLQPARPTSCGSDCGNLNTPLVSTPEPLGAETGGVELGSVDENRPDDQSQTPPLGVAAGGQGAGTGSQDCLPRDSGLPEDPAEEGPLHHIATDKNTDSALRGGPWTPRFQEIFDKGGMTLQDPANLVRVPGHYGPHPELYHQTVFDRLTQATEGLSGDDYTHALRSELNRIGNEAQQPGSDINDLLTGGC